MATCNLDALCSTPLLTRFSTFLSSFPPSLLLHPECFLWSIIRFRSEEIESISPCLSLQTRGAQLWSQSACLYIQNASRASFWRLRLLQTWGWCVGETSQLCLFAVESLSCCLLLLPSSLPSLLPFPLSCPALPSLLSFLTK